MFRDALLKQTMQELLGVLECPNEITDLVKKNLKSNKMELTIENIKLCLQELKLAKYYNLRWTIYRQLNQDIPYRDFSMYTDKIIKEYQEFHQVYKTIYLTDIPIEYVVKKLIQKFMPNYSEFPDEIKTISRLKICEERYHHVEKLIQTK
jgi:hypothetical protein